VKVERSFFGETFLALMTFEFLDTQMLDSKLTTHTMKDDDTKLLGWTVKAQTLFTVGCLISSAEVIYILAKLCGSY
jgi:hypothetical protein